MKKFGLEFANSIRTPMSPNIKLTVDLLGKSVDSSLWIDLFLSSLLLMHLHLVLCFALFLFIFFSVLVYFVFHIKIKKNWKIQKQCVFVYIGTCVPWMAIETKFSKLCIFCSLDEYRYAQLSKWVLWLLFVMSKIKLSFVLNTRITFFDEKD